jgi:hypothetical protein
MKETFVLLIISICSTLLFIYVRNTDAHNSRPEHFTEEETNSSIVHSALITAKQNSVKYQVLPKVEDLFTTYFAPFKITGPSAGFYTVGKDTFYTEFNKIINVDFKDNLYVLFIFTGGMAGHGFLDGYLHKYESHATWGVLSILKFKKSASGWVLDEFVQDCPCGTQSHGWTEIPKIINIDNKFMFLESKVSDGGQGYQEWSIALCNFNKLSQYKFIRIGASDDGANEPPTISYDSKHSYHILNYRKPYVRLKTKGFEKAQPMDGIFYYSLDF